MYTQRIHTYSAEEHFTKNKLEKNNGNRLKAEKSFFPLSDNQEEPSNASLN